MFCRIYYDIFILKANKITNAEDRFMDYEDFYRQFQIKEKNVKDTLKRQQSAYKNISAKAAKGDLKNIAKDMSAMENYLAEQTVYLQELKEAAGSFDSKEYMENGDFAKQMLDCCEKQGVDVKGDFPIYEMFPYKIKIDSENQEINIDRKKMQCVRPEYLAADIKKNREKLMKASFNAYAFLNEIEEVYDMLSDIKGKGEKGRRDQELLLKDI